MAREKRTRKSTSVSISVDDEVPPVINGNGQMNGSPVKPATPSKTEDKRPLGERETAIPVVSKDGKTQKGKNANAGSMHILLTQGIMANDSVKVDSVIRNMNAEIITATLKELQPMQVLPLLKIIENRLRTRNANDIRPTIRWAQIAFSIHMPYLSSLPNLEKEIGGLIGWLKSRIVHQKDLLALHGKISTIADQIKRRTNKVVIAQHPLVVFNNDVDSDSEDFDTIASDDDGESSEDDWWDDNELKGNEEDENDDDEADDDGDDNDSDSDMDQMENGNTSESGSDEEENEEEDMDVG